MSDSFFSWRDSAPSAFDILSGLMPRQVKAPKAPPKGRSNHEDETPLFLLPSGLFSRLCAYVDVRGICALQCTCRHLLLEAASNEVWRTVCAIRKIRLVDGADESTVNWQQLFASLAQVWQFPRVRGLGWTFSSPEELNRVADSMKRMGARRTQPLTVVRRQIPAPEFWQWWFVAVVRNPKRAQVKQERGASAGYGYASGAAAAAAAGHAGVGGVGRNGVSGFTRGAVAKAEGRTKPKARRVKITLKTSSGNSVSASTTTTALHSPPALSTRNSPRMGAMLLPPGARSPVRVPSLSLAPPKSPASLPPRLPPRPGGPPATSPGQRACCPYDYVSKADLRLQVKALVAEASTTGVRVQQLRSLHRSMMKHAKNPQDLFNIPVDPIAFNIPDYLKVIREPMDLGLVKKKLEEGCYHMTNDYAYDVRLVFANAQRFNPLGHWINSAAATLSQFFEEKLRRMETKVGIERQRQEGHACETCHGLTCRACGEGCLHFTPNPLRCAGPCGSLIRRGSLYHYNEKEDAELCQRCFKRVTGSIRGAAAASRDANLAASRGVDGSGSKGGNGGRNGSTGGAGGAEKVEGASEEVQGGNDGGDDMDGHSDDDDDEDSTQRDMESIDKSTVADRQRKKILHIKDPSLWIQDRWDPDWGVAEPWVQCGCCLEVYHQVCGMHDPLLTSNQGAKVSFVCIFCRVKNGSEPPSPLAAGPEPSPTELGALRVDTSRNIPKPKIGGLGRVRGGRGGRGRGRGRGGRGGRKSAAAIAAAAAVEAASMTSPGKTLPTPYSVPANILTLTDKTAALDAFKPYKVPAPVTSARYDASSLPQDTMSRFIETAIKDELRSLGEPVAADSIALRVVSNCSKEAKVNRNVCEGFKCGGTAGGGSPTSRASGLTYAAKFPYRSKAIFLFQRLDGLDVLLYVMYVQEYGTDCPPPNARQVYISYLDSVQYFRPRQYRTPVYHTLLVSYLDYVKRRGFTAAHIWACPPLRAGSYIFPSRPAEQQVPTGQRLRSWYQQMLVLARERGEVVVGQATMYDEFFSGMGDPTAAAGRRKAKAKSHHAGAVARRTTAKGSLAGSGRGGEPVREFRWSRGLPPYFDGDWWTLQAETVVKSARWQQPKRLLRQLMEHQLNRQGIFNSPVDALAVPDYRRVIKHPMDLGSVKLKLEKGNVYKTRKEYADDVRLVFTNAMAYNQQGHWVHDVAKTLLAHFEQRLKNPVSRSGRPLGSSPRDAALEAKLLGSPPGAPPATGRRKGVGSGGFPASPTVIMAENPTGHQAPAPSDTLASVWHSMLQTTATFLIGTKDEHIIPALHWHCTLCHQPAGLVPGNSGRAWVCKRPPPKKSDLTTTGSAHPGGSGGGSSTVVTTAAAKPSGGAVGGVGGAAAPPAETVPPCLCLCSECYEAESSSKVLDDYGLDPRQLEEVDVTVGDCSDPDPPMPGSPFADVRNTFFEDCQEGNFNFDTLRRAKHSTMMILHRIHGLHTRGMKRALKEER